MYQNKDVQRVFNRAVRVALAVSVGIILAHDYIRIHVMPPVLKFVNAYGSFLLYLMFYVFISCSLFLIFIVWWLEWGDKKKGSYVSRYVSQLVCGNYYGNYRRTNIYKAIKTCLSKFSQETLEDGDENRDDPLAPAYREQREDSGPDHESHSQRKPAVEAPDDMTDGAHKTYHKNGRLEKEFTCENKMLAGAYRTYYDDGRLHQEKYFKGGPSGKAFAAQAS